jgi:hypothetical protein
VLSYGRLRSQMVQFRPKPRSQTREAPIEAILLTGADLDHTLGLFLLRENELPILVHALEAIKQAVEQVLRMTDVLSCYCGIQWVAPHYFKPLLCRDGTESAALSTKQLQSRGLVPETGGMIIIRAVSSMCCASQPLASPSCWRQRPRNWSPS